MNSIEHDLMCALALLDLRPLAPEFGVHAAAHGDILQHLVPGLALNNERRLVTRSGETVRDYMSAKLAHLKASPEASHYFQAASAPEPAEAVQASKPALKLSRKMSAREKLSLGNGVDPYDGF